MMPIERTRRDLHPIDGAGKGNFRMLARERVGRKGSVKILAVGSGPALRRLHRGRSRSNRCTSMAAIQFGRALQK